METPTDAQRRMLLAIDACSSREKDMPADGWGEVFTHFVADEGEGERAKYLVMRNFDATAEACERRGWIRVEEGCYVSLTEAGELVLKRAQDLRRALRAVSR